MQVEVDKGRFDVPMFHFYL